MVDSFNISTDVDWEKKKVFGYIQNSGILAGDDHFFALTDSEGTFLTMPVGSTVSNLLSNKKASVSFSPFTGYPQAFGITGRASGDIVNLTTATQHNSGSVNNFL